MHESRGLRNNNPLNIRKSNVKYIGEIVSDDKSFKKFSSLAYGYRAAFRILKTYYFRYNLITISAIINRWAPTNENDTSSYISAVSNKIGISKSKALKWGSEEFVPIVAAMSYVENGVAADMNAVKEGWLLSKQTDVEK